MKNNMKKQLRKAILPLACLAALFATCNDDAGIGCITAMAVVAGTAGGKHIAGEPLTVELAKTESPDLLRNEIDRRIVKIRPMATPIDQLSRWAGAKHAGSMIVDYYSVDTRPTTALTVSAFTGCTDDEGSDRFQKARLSTDNNDLFEASETILVKGVAGYQPDGKTQSSQDLVLYVVEKEASTGMLNVVTVNGQTIGEYENCIPTIPSGTTLVRMGRAATELDVQTPQFEALPKKSRNYCQIFKMQIEQSTLQKIADKEVNWNLSDQEEAAIYDMRLGMEKNFLFGVKRSLYDYRKKETVMFTGGIWFQAGKEFSYDKSSLNQDTLIEMMREAFTGNAGSKRKVLIGGSGLIEAINKIDYTKVVNTRETVTKWGIDFSEINSKFGRLYVLLSEVFDDCGMPDDGMIIDPAYLQKYSHLPFGTEALDLKTAGLRNTDALVLTEASCLVLRYPKAHMRIVAE